MKDVPIPAADVDATLRAQQQSAFHEILSGRFSCRAFLPEPVPRATIEAILAMAQRTATWCNTQPWRLWIGSGAGTERLREALYAHAAGGASTASDIAWPREYRGVFLKRRRDTGFKLYQSLGILREDLAARNRQLLENYRFFGAPHIALLTTDEALGAYGALGCGAYVSTFLLAARAHGVDSIALAAIAHHSEFVRSLFSVPDDQVVVCAIAFGHADASHAANHFKTDRAALEEFVTWVDS